MARSTVELELVAQVSEATKTVKRFADDTKKQLSGISLASNITAIASGFNLLRDVAGGALGTINDFLSDAVGEAVEAERSITSLANSMRIVGDFSEEALNQFTNLADELAKTTTLTDDQVISAAALAKTYQLTNKETKQVIEAAKDLSAITGQDLNTSVEKLAKTYNGFVDKSLKQLVPGLKSLTQEQLASGEAVKLVGDRFDGTAETLTNTFGGALKQLNNSISEFKEQIGKIVTESEGAIQVIKIAAQAINELGKATVFVVKNLNIFETVLGAIGAASPSVAILLRIASGFKSVKEESNDAAEGTRELLDQIKSAARSGGAKIATDEEIKNRRSALRAQEDALEKFNQVRASLETVGLSEVEKINIEAQERINAVRAGVSGGALSASKAQDTIKRIEFERITKVRAFEEKQQEELVKNLLDLRKKTADRLQGIINDPIGSLIRGDTDQGTALAAGLAQKVLKGAQGAKELLQAGAGAAASALLGPAFGPVAGEIVGILSQGPEEVKKQVQEFARAIPDLIKNLAESLPILIETLVTELPPALAKAMPTVAIGFSTALAKNIPQIVKGFAEGLVQAAKDFVKAIIDQIKSVGGLLDGISGQGSGGIFEGIPVLGAVGGFLGLAGGGKIPDSPRFSGDKFGPVALNAGERVLDDGLNRKLERFLTSGGSSQTLNVNFAIGQQQFARAVLDLNRKGFRTA
jgi:hypothetical protein